MFSQFKQIIKESSIDDKINTISKKIQNKLIMNGAGGGSPNKGNVDRGFKLTFSNIIFIPPPLPTISNNPLLFQGNPDEKTEYAENPFTFYYEEFQEEFPIVNSIVQQQIPTIIPEPLYGNHPYGFNFEEYNNKRLSLNVLQVDSKPHFLKIPNQNPIKNYASTPVAARILSKVELMACQHPTNITYICITDTTFTSREKRAFLKKLATFSSVETLILKGCSIGRFANGTRFPSLRFLDLSQNSFKNQSDLRKIVKHSPWLEFLNLTGNGYSNGNELEFKQKQNRLCSALPALENLNGKLLSVDERIAAISLYGPTARRQQLEKIRWELHLDNLPDVRSIRTIHPGWQPQAILNIQFSNCQLRHFYIGHFINLNSLDLSRNLLTDISGSGIERCSHLQYVNLSNNSLSRLDSTIGMFEYTPSIRCVVLAPGNLAITNSNRNDYRKELIYTTRNTMGTNRSIGIQQIDNDLVSIDEKVSIIYEFELKSNGNNIANAIKVSSEYRWKLLIIERFGHKQLTTIPMFFEHIKQLTFIKLSLAIVDCSFFKSIEIIDFSGNDLQSFTGLNALYSLRILLLLDNPRLETTHITSQLDQLERLESINLSVSTDSNHTRYNKHSTLKLQSYRNHVLSIVIPKNRSFVLLDNSIITMSERVEAYATAGYSIELVEKYRFFLALTVNCTLPFNRLLYPDQVEIGKQYDPTQITTLRRLRDCSLTSQVLNFSFFNNVVEIDLTNNRLADIIHIGLQSLVSLQKICLINNQISNTLPMIAQLLDGMKSLEIIAIRGNPCMKSPQDRLSLIGYMSTMKSTIPSTPLRVIDTDITIYDKVEGWKLIGGPLNDAEMLKLNYIVQYKQIDLYDHNLTNLELCDCALEYLDISPFLNLKTLLLANNKFKSLVNLVGIAVSGQQLFALDLRNNNFESLEEMKSLILQLPNLSVIGLSGNPFSVVGSNGSSKTLTTTSYNYRLKLIAAISPLSQHHLYPLSILDESVITPNEIVESLNTHSVVDKKELLFNISLLRKSIQPDYSSLIELDLSCCSLSFLNFTNLQSLIVLSLSDNNISDSNLKESGIASLGNLKALDIRNNRLKDLSILAKIIDLLNLETLFLDENACFEKDTPKDRIALFKKLTNSRILSTMKYLNGTLITSNDTIKFNSKNK